MLPGIRSYAAVIFLLYFWNLRKPQQKMMMQDAATPERHYDTTRDLTQYSALSRFREAGHRARTGNEK